MPLPARIKRLTARGVRMPAPERVWIADDVDPDRVAAGAILHPGVRLQGRDTLVGPGCELGRDGPVVIDNAWLAAGAAVASGTVAGCAIGPQASLGPNVHARPGCLLEENTACGHAAGLKHTLLLANSVLGSLVNFCDCLLAGGPDRRRHSEVGSSYVHFNFTPHGDKATPSLIGDVPRGVMLDRAPIFLGGQGGLVGPTRLAFGTLIPAGVIQRHDVEPENTLAGDSPPPRRPPRRFQAGRYGSIARLLRNNLAYLGNLHALREWYRHARTPLAAPGHERDWHEGALSVLDLAIEERVRRLGELAGNMERSLALARDAHGEPLPDQPYALQQQLATAWPDWAPRLGAAAQHPGDTARRDAFVSRLAREDGEPFPALIGRLPPAARAAGTAWLDSVVDSVTGTQPALPSPPGGPPHD